MFQWYLSNTKRRRGIEILNEPCADSLLKSRRFSKQTATSKNVPTSAVEMVKQQMHIFRLCFRCDENKLERLSRQCRDLADYVGWFRSRETGMNDAEVKTGSLSLFSVDDSPQRSRVWFVTPQRHGHQTQEGKSIYRLPYLSKLKRKISLHS